MAALTVQDISLSGLEPTYASAAAGGDTFVNDGDVFFHIINSDTASKTVTLTTAGKIQGINIADITVTVPASEDRMIGHFPPAIFNSGSTGVSVSYSAVTSVTVAAIRLDR